MVTYAARLWLLLLRLRCVCAFCVRVCASFMDDKCACGRDVSPVAAYYYHYIIFFSWLLFNTAIHHYLLTLPIGLQCDDRLDNASLLACEGIRGDSAPTTCTHHHHCTLLFISAAAATVSSPSSSLSFRCRSSRPSYVVFNIIGGCDVFFFVFMRMY